MERFLAGEGGEIVGSFGGYYKGEKKKQKKDKEGKGPSLGGRSFQLPEVVKKKKKDTW